MSGQYDLTAAEIAAEKKRKQQRTLNKTTSAQQVLAENQARSAALAVQQRLQEQAVAQHRAMLQLAASDPHMYAQVMREGGSDTLSQRVAPAQQPWGTRTPMGPPVAAPLSQTIPPSQQPQMGPPVRLSQTLTPAQQPQARNLNGGPVAYGHPGATNHRTQSAVGNAVSTRTPRPGQVAPTGWAATGTVRSYEAPRYDIPTDAEMGMAPHPAIAQRALAQTFGELDPTEVYRQAQLKTLLGGREANSLPLDQIIQQAMGSRAMYYQPGGADDPYRGQPGYSGMPYTSSMTVGGGTGDPTISGFHPGNQVVEAAHGPGLQQTPQLAALLAARNATADQLKSKEFMDTLEAIMREGGMTPAPRNY